MLMKGEFSNLRRKMDEANYAAKVDKERINEEHVEENKQAKIAADKRINDLTQDNLKFREDTVSKFKNDQEIALDNYKSQMRMTELKAEQGAITTRNTNNKIVENQRIKFGNTIKTN